MEAVMFKSLKSKLIVPMISMLVVLVALLIGLGAISQRTLGTTLTRARVDSSVSVAKQWLTNIEKQMYLAAIAVARNDIMTDTLRRWNSGDNRDLVRRELLTYLTEAVTISGASSFIVRDASGVTVMRHHDPNNYNDHDGSLSAAAALRGESSTSFFSTVSEPMAIVATIPVRNAGEIIGVVTALYFLHTEEFVDSFKEIFKAETTVFVGNIRAATTLKSADGRRLTGTEAPQEVAQQVLVNKIDFSGGIDILGDHHYVHYFPLLNPAGATLGMIFIGFSSADTRASVEKSSWEMVIIGAIGLLLVAAVMFFMVLRTLKPINVLSKTLNDIANGEGDLTVRIESKSQDEIGKVSEYFNQTIQKIRKLVAAIKEQSVLLSDIGNNLADDVNQTASAMNQITANIQSIKNRIVTQSASVSETNATMEQVVNNIKTLNGHVESQGDNIAKASSAVEEMVANTRSVTSTLVSSSADLKTLLEASEVGRSGLQAVADDIQNIAHESEGLMEINSVMENIASQTNLLSMNAAIEAAHAGEAGKGFAVVADEIRKLAEGSSKQSKVIGVTLRKIKESIEKITASTENVMNKFQAIDSSVKLVAGQGENMRCAMEEQGEGSKQTLEGISRLNEISRDVQSGSQEMFEGAKEVINESSNLENITQEIASSMNEMASGVQQINEAVNSLNNMGSKNREALGVLISEVGRFKVED